MKDIYISSLAMQGKSAEEMIEICSTRGWALEFSSGLPYHDEMEAIYTNAKIKRMPHNYFPAPQVPFVLNLASTDPEIRNKSINHVKNGLRLARQSNSPFFSAHAGFCVDPKPTELGNKIKLDKEFSREQNKAVFIESLHEIMDEADRLNIDFLIENNVLTSFNLPANGINPLLCCEAKEIIEIITEVRHNRLGLLLDTAHLKVSCQTLRLDPNAEVAQISQIVRGIHHSDNDGMSDTNMALTPAYWFLENLGTYRDVVHVLEIKNSKIDLIQQQLNLLLSNGS
jgi:sugar phosphate isomerase/epimerase